MAETKSKGLRICYDDLGQGEPALLMMPGWRANRTVFRDLIPRLSRHRRVLALDWRGHGESAAARKDFGDEGLIEDALAVINTSGAGRVVPVALAHSGWVAIELRRLLERKIVRLVHIEWLILEAPPPFVQALEGMQSPERWKETVQQTFSLWLHGIDIPALRRFVLEEMGAYGFEMWARAARSISASYNQWSSPLASLAALIPPVPVLHLYAQPDDQRFLEAQRTFADAHAWFSFHRLNAQSHFPMFEVPEEMARAIEQFVSSAR